MNAAGKVQVTLAERKSVPFAVLTVAADRSRRQQICRPQAKRRQMPLAFDPVSIRPPVGTPDVWLTVARILVRP